MKHSTLTMSTVALLAAASLLAGCSGDARRARRKRDKRPPPAGDATVLTDAPSAASDAATSDVLPTLDPSEITVGAVLSAQEIGRLPVGV